MKKIFFLIITVISLNTIAQKDYAQYHNAWRLGLNIGGAWQTADYRSCWGMAGGLTLEKGFAENSTNFFSWALRGRYLAANTYGMDYNRNYNIAGNNAYNGTYDPKVNFVDSVSMGRQYVYDNYKTTLYEGSLELQVSFNRLRAQTHVILNLWGGIGITSYRAKSNLLDGNGKMYDFSKVDSSGNKSMALNSYNGLIDKKYESYALGSRSGNLITFSPSAGIGLGYQFSPVFSLLLEYKVTFPQGTNADFLDGKIGANNDVIAGSNDYYHYTGINFLFTLRGKHKTTTPKDETVYTNTVVPVVPVTPVDPVVPTASVTPEIPVVVTTPVTTPVEVPAPVISFITPPVNGFAVAAQQYKISAQVLNVTNQNQIRLKVNNTDYTNFVFNAQTHILEFNGNLNVGSNPVQIIATNPSGTDNKSTSVIYQLQKVSGNPPTLTIVNPASCPANSNTKLLVLNANSTNVTSKSNVSVKINGVLSSVYSFNLSTGRINAPLNLMEGNNSVEVVVSNAYGRDSKTCFINYLPAKQTEPLPVVSFINPPQSEFVSPEQAYTVKAQVLNVTGQNNISVNFNGLATPFFYDATNKQISFTTTLSIGSNTVSVTANNLSGNDSKTSTVIYRTTRSTTSTGLPPVVGLLLPSALQSTVNTATYNFKLRVANVASKNDIEVIFNGNNVSSFSHNPATKEIYFNTGLIAGNNTLFVKARNTFGVDSKTINLNYQPVIIEKHPPVVTMVIPSASYAISGVAGYTFKANILNVPASSGLTVKLNGTTINGFVYDGSGLSFGATLQQGANTFEVTAMNMDGSDTKTVTVNYIPKTQITLTPVVGLISPISPISVTTNTLYSFKLSVINVESAANIEVVFNGVNQTDFSYNTSTKELDFQPVLIPGNNTLIVKGTNQFGSDSKQIEVTYRPRVFVKRPPVVTFIDPQTTSITQESNYVFKANVTNVPSASGLVITYNGVVISDYSYDGANFSYTATLNNGINNLQISATNNDGNSTKSASVNYRKRFTTQDPPLVTILSPVNTPTITIGYYDFEFKVLNALQSDINVSLNGVPVTYTFTDNHGTFSSKVDPGAIVLLVKATNSGGTSTASETLIYEYNTPPVDTVPPTRGDSPGQTSSQIGDPIMNIVICHHSTQPGIQPETITVHQSLLVEHIAHGDTQGACPVQDNIIKVITPGRINPAKGDTLKLKPTTTPRSPR